MTTSELHYVAVSKINNKKVVFYVGISSIPLSFGHSLCWSEKVFCLGDVGILHSATMKICIFEPFPAQWKVGVNKKKIFSRYELLLKDQKCVLCII